METKDIIEKCINWIRSEFTASQKKNAIVHITSTPSSIVSAKLCVNALGTAHVIGVCTPDEDNGETNVDPEIICKLLKIKLITIPIHWFIREASLADIPFTEKSSVNLKDRFRSNMLYCVADELDGLVISDINYSNVHVCDFTKFGTSVGDLLPLRYLCLKEIKNIGEELRIPQYWLKLEDRPISIKNITYDEIDDFFINETKDVTLMNKIEEVYSKNVKKWNLDNSFEV